MLHYPEVADVPIQDLRKPAVLREWLRKLKKDGRANVVWKTTDDGKKVQTIERGGPMAPYSILNVTKAVGALFEDAIAEDWIELDANPIRHPKVKEVIPIAQRSGKASSGEEVIVVFPKPVVEAYVGNARIPEWRRVRMLVAVLTGLNEGELSGLKLGSVKLDDPIPHLLVANALVTRHEDGYAKDGDLKNEFRSRAVPLHPLAVRVLKAWKEHGWSRWVGSRRVCSDAGYERALSRPPAPPPKETDYVFANRDRKGWRPSMAKMIKVDLRAIGLPDNDGSNPYTAQATRSTFATWMTEAGCPKSDLQRLIGHSKGDVAESSYIAKGSLLERNASLIAHLVLAADGVVAPAGAFAFGVGIRSVAAGRTAESAAVRGRFAAATQAKYLHAR